MLDGTHAYGLTLMAYYNSIIQGMTITSLEAGFDVILDETFMRRIDLEKAFDLYLPYALEIAVVDLTSVSLEDCVERDARRPKPLGYKVIHEYQEELEESGETCSIIASYVENSIPSTLDTKISLIKLQNGHEELRSSWSMASGKPLMDTFATNG